MNTTNELNIVTDLSSSIEPLLKHIVRGKSFPDEENIRKSSGGRNAYDIRESILQQAIDIVKSTGWTEKMDKNVDEILKVASKLYEFVENKRR